MNESNSIRFNHGHLCEILRAANDTQLQDVIEDVKKEQKRRQEAVRAIAAGKIFNAIREAVKAGLIVSITTTDDFENPDCVIHANNLFLTNVTIENEEDE